MAIVERIEIEQGYEVIQETTQLCEGITLVVSKDDLGESAELNFGTQSLMFEWGTDYEKLFDDLQSMTVKELFDILAN